MDINKIKRKLNIIYIKQIYIPQIMIYQIIINDLLYIGKNNNMKVN